MARKRTSFYCKNCGYESAKWIGQCPSCKEWNSFSEEPVPEDASKNRGWTGPHQEVTEPVSITEIDIDKDRRLSCPDQELSRVLGGGIVPGSVVLVGGEPGIGKSTLMLQTALQMKQRVLYVSGEESAQQLKLRANRIMKEQNKEFVVLTETRVNSVLSYADHLQPGLIIIDSIQTLYSSSIEAIQGSISQIRQCTGELMQFAKTSNVPVFLVGHITKEGELAGPKILEHMVDTVLQFEGDRNFLYRILRASKNRFGSTDEIGIYEMQSSGLREVSNPSELLITQRDAPVAGVAIGATMEGSRPLLIEIQALVSRAAYGTPQRTATGFDYRRLSMLLAVLEKRLDVPLSSQDVFLNMAGGLRINDPAVDLAVCMAILSAHYGVPVDHEYCFAAEVGLSGELRTVPRIEARVNESVKLGYHQIYVSKFAKKTTNSGPLFLAASLSEVAAKIFK